MRAREFTENLPSVTRAQQAIPQILARAQRDYDAWDEDDRDTYAGGGICHIIADSVCDVLSDAGIECTPVSCSHEQHVYVAARFAEGIYTIDIPYHIYEQGGGFSWKKLPDIRFQPRDVVFYKVSGDPADWRDYLDEGMRDVVNFVRNIGSERDAPIVMMTNPQNTGARTASGQRMRIEDFPLKTVAVSELRPWEPMIKMRDLPSQRTVASLIKTLQQGGRIPPLLVTPVRGGYRIIDGHHRYAALQRAGVEQAPVRVVDPRLIRYSDEVREALKITLERYGHLGAQTVTESLDQPYRIKWGRSMHGDYDALATLDDGTYLSIMFNNESKNNWMVEFYRNNRQEVTGEGDAQRVFATVLTAIAQFIKKKKPVSLFFSAVKEDDPKGSREKLYDRLVQRYAGSLGYTVHQGRTPMGSMAYKLTRKQQGVAESLDQPHQTQLGPQLFVSRQTTTEDIKPRGAAWTSTAQKTPQGFTSDWVEWCKDNMAQWVTDTGILYDVAPGARILLLRTDRDVIQVARRYGLEIKNSFDLFEKMDWDVLRQDYDAVHHIPQGRDPFMSAWDVESTAWFDRKFLTNPRRVTVDTGKTHDIGETGKSGMAEGRISDLDQDLQDQQWEAVVGRVEHGVRRGEDPDHMSLALYRWATGEMFDVDEELERRGFRSVRDLADHIRDHGGRYVPPKFDLGSAALLKDIDRQPRQRPDDVAENSAHGRAGRVIDMLEQGNLEISRWLEENPRLLESQEGWSEIKSLFQRISGDQPRIGERYAVLNLIAVPPGKMLLQQGFTRPATLIKIRDRGAYRQYEFDVDGDRVRYPEDHRAGDQLSRTFLFQDPAAVAKTQTFVALTLSGWDIRNRLDENFADGKIKGKSRPGRVKRSGASCKGSVTDLRARAQKYGGERGKMYQWCLNMKSGRKKSS